MILVFRAKFAGMNMVLLESVTKHYGDKLLLDKVSLGINYGQKMALIASNGAGKTTLLNLIAGKEVPEEGSIRHHPESTLGYLEQEPVFDEKLNILELLFEDEENPITRAISNYEQALKEKKEDTALEVAIAEMDRQNAWAYEARIKGILGKLGLNDFQARVKQLSGGQKKRLALARVLLKEPDFLILDEPTNHLDLEMIEWLEEYLMKQNVTLLLVTHDRYFLDRVCDSIIELEAGRLQLFKGGYSYYLEKKAELVNARERETEKARSLVKKELEWIRRMPKARGTKNKARIDSFYALKEKAAGRALSEGPEFEINATRLGNKIIEMKNVSKAYGDKVLFRGFSYVFKRYEKVGIAGPNGSGKTTFLKLLTGVESPDTGTIKKGSTVKIGHFRQENPEEFYGKRSIDIVKEKAEIIELKNGRSLGVTQFMELFEFDTNRQYTYYESLSGGEKRRLHLVRVLMSNPNFLILDEPTNDLDLITLQTLEQFLLDFNGSVVLVSHDRYFMDKIIDHLFVFKGEGEIIDFPGNYSQFRDYEKKVKKQEKKEPKAEKKGKQREKKKLGYMEQREFEQLGKDIEALEIRQKELSERLQTGESDYEKIMRWSEELKKIEETLSEKEDRWLKLSEYVG